VATCTTSGPTRSTHARTSVGTGNASASDSYAGQRRGPVDAEPDGARHALVAGADDRAAELPTCEGGRQSPHRPGDAVHLGERVREHERPGPGLVGRDAEEAALDRRERLPRVRVMVRGREIRRPQCGGECNRAQPSSERRKRRELYASGPRPFPEEPREVRHRVRDLLVARCRVLRVGVEEALDAGRDHLGQLTAARSVRVDDERGERVRELRRGTVRAAGCTHAGAHLVQELLRRRRPCLRPRRRDVELIRGLRSRL
jgi:hypothetical protein